MKRSLSVCHVILDITYRNCCRFDFLTHEAGGAEDLSQVRDGLLISLESIDDDLADDGLEP
jgi:hypothetical protein